MSTTRPYSPGDRGPEPSGASGASEEDTPSGAPSVMGATVSSVPPSGADAGVAGASSGRQVRRLELRGESGVVPLARDFTRQALYAWGWLPAAAADRRAAAEDVLLVVSELVTNACLHAEGPDELVLTCDNKVIRLEVSDRGTGQPAPRNPHRAGRPGGHGMFIVQRLCLDWGVLRSPGRPGKTVWAELGAPA
ncbi:Histidine kinase-like ATPase domain-containing protein [Streptomyces misionensis]|uniref:Histidine kinase-like ATPase domain-containing protein n=1 Tax=Streptomyces misionensis TaxID=67331 RepID=A0A1H4WXT7_9ACTN|nr:ATP-binding protein [Streptomyces misionensis]SEC97401.1 Histidine kinase-like ATPase domain-containing protein [Streptomyces misionensis]